MKNALVIQLSGRDAVLQSTPALAALRKARPDACIHVLARKPFGDALHGNPDADEVIEWDMDAPAPRDEEERFLARPGGPVTARRLSELREFLRPLREKRFDAVYNLSNEAMGALVASLLKPRESAGLVLCQDRHYRVRDDMSAAASGDWLRCVYVSREVESLKLFNLADAFTRACGGAEAPSPPRVTVSPADERYAEEVIGHCSPADAAGLIVIQPGLSRGPAGRDGAEEADARWPAPHWVALAGRLRRAGHGLLFLGGASERSEMEAMARAVSAAAHSPAPKRAPLRNAKRDGEAGRRMLLSSSLVAEGKTALRGTEKAGEGVLRVAGPASVGQFAALLRRCRLLVSADAATAQAAAAAGTPCLFLALGSTSARESGPSGEGHFVLEPKTRGRPFKPGQPSGDLSCRPFDHAQGGPEGNRTGRDVPDPDAALAAVECALSDGRDVPESLRCARAVLHRSGRMPDGLLGLRPLGRPALTLNDLLVLMLRTCLLRRRLGPRSAASRLDASGGSWRPWLDEVFEWYSIGDRERLLGRAAQAAESFAMLRRIAQLGVQTAPAPILDPRSEAGAGSDRGPAMQASQGWIERRILALEENETLRLPVALFRRSLLDMELLPSREKAVAHRWNCHLLAEECGFVAQSLWDFARRAGLRDKNGESAKTRNRPWRPICMTPSGFTSSSYRR